MTKDSHHISRPNCNFAKALIFLWLFLLVRGFFYSVLLPPWEGYDEPYHFSFIQYVAAHHTLPTAATPVSREVEASLHLLPLSWEQRLHVMKPPIYTQEQYWQLSDGVRNELRAQLRSIPAGWQCQTGAAPAMYEAQQAPLYYWIMSVPMRFAERWSLPGRILLVRFLSVLLMSLVVPIVYVTATRILGDRAQGLATVAVISCMPELMINTSRAGNESLAIVVFSLLTLLLMFAVEPRQSKWFLAAGVVLGVGLLSKAYFLSAVVAFVLTVAYSAWRRAEERRQILLFGGLGLLLAGALSFDWYWRNYSLSGSWSGEENDAIAIHRGLGHLLASVVHVRWIGGVTSVLVSHVWFGGWSFLKLPRPVYLLFALGMAAATFGLAKLVAKDRFRNPQLYVLFVLYVCFWLGLLYDILVVTVATGVSASDGWYMYCVVLPEVLLVVLGFYALVPARLRWMVLPVLAGVFAVTDLYGVCFLLAPYYTGLIAHSAGSGAVHALNLAHLYAPGRLILERLAMDKPDALTPPIIGAMGLFYLVATICTVFTAYAALRHIRDA
jgi:4-amino-4-deoxy-L-arabinose transferase-like glycosyltransferase